MYITGSQGSLFAINAQDAIHQHQGLVRQTCLNGYGYREEVVAKSGNYSFLVHFHQFVGKEEKCAGQFYFIQIQLVMIFKTVFYDSGI